jgi:hypothetical protein
VRIRFTAWIFRIVATALFLDEVLIAFSIKGNAHLTGKASVEFKQETAETLVAGANRAARRRILLAK